MKRSLLKVTILGLALAYTTQGYSQQDSKSIFIGLGPAFAVNKKGEGLGYNVDCGYQSSLWKDKLRFVSSLTFSSYNNQGITDVPDLHFSSIGVKSGLNFDLFQIGIFSPFIGLGVSAYYVDGLEGTGGWTQSKTNSQSFNDALILADIMAGFRFYSHESNISYELRLFDVSTNFALNDELLETSIINFFILINLK